MFKTIALIAAVIAGYFFFFNDSGLIKTSNLEANSESGLKVVTTDDLHSLAVPDMFTVVELYTTSCPGCKKLKKYYDKFLPRRPDIAVRRVRLPEDWSADEVSAQYSTNVMGTPHILIFDQDQEVIAEDDGNKRHGSTLLKKWIAASL